MQSQIYSFEEEVVLGHPLRVGVHELTCDRLLCDQMAAWLIPGGASLCHPCAGSFGVGNGETPSVPLGELVGDERWREARHADYVERLRRLRPLPRDSRRDRVLDELAGRTVNAVVASLAQPE